MSIAPFEDTGWAVKISKKDACITLRLAVHWRRNADNVNKFDPHDHRSHPGVRSPVCIAPLRGDKGRWFPFCRITEGVTASPDIASGPDSRITKQAAKHGGRTTGPLKESGFSTGQLGERGTLLRMGSRLVKVHPYILLLASKLTRRLRKARCSSQVDQQWLTCLSVPPQNTWQLHQ